MWIEANKKMREEAVPIMEEIEQLVQKKLHDHKIE
jgi:hypothetical protein